MNDKSPLRLVWSEGRPVQPSNCFGGTVAPLGIYDDWHFYRATAGELVALKPYKHNRHEIERLFGRSRQALDQLHGLWPRGRSGWNVEKAADALMSACRLAGVVDPRALGFRIKLPRRSVSAIWGSDCPNLVGERGKG